MANSAVLAHVVLVITAGVLFYGAWTDLRHYKIRNEFVVVLAGLFVVHAVVSGRWITMQWNFAVAFVVFLVLLIFYIRKGMGGGDVKLLTVAYLWVGYTCMLPFTLLLLVSAVVFVIFAKLGLINTVGSDRKRMPFAPVVAAALIGTFLLGCLDQPPPTLDQSGPSRSIG